MKKKQAMALLLAAGASAAIYSDVQAAEVIQSSDLVVDSKFQGAGQSSTSEARIVEPVIAQKIMYEYVPNAIHQIFTAFPALKESADKQVGMNLKIEVKEIPHLGLATYYGNSNGIKTVGIVVDKGHYMNQDGTIKDNRQDIETLVTHELTHAIMFYTLPKGFPYWFVEGLAELTSGGMGSGHAYTLNRYSLDLYKSGPKDTKLDADIKNFLKNNLPDKSPYESGYLLTAFLGHKAYGVPTADVSAITIKEGWNKMFAHRIINGATFNETVEKYTGIEDIVNKSTELFSNPSDELVQFTKEFAYACRKGWGSVIAPSFDSTHYNILGNEQDLKIPVKIIKMDVDGFGEVYRDPSVAPPGGNNGDGLPPLVTPPGDNNGGGTLTPEQPGYNDVVVVNNVKLKDTVTVSNVTKGDLVKVYSDASKSKVIGKATAKRDNVVIKISKGLPTEEHVIYVTKKAKGKGTVESEPTPIKFDAEKMTISPNVNNIKVVNNVGNKKDTITVTNVNAKDIVKVYASEAEAKNAKAKPIGTAKVKRAGEVTVKIRKGFNLAEYPGEVYVTVQSYNERNSEPVAVEVKATPKTATVDTANVTVNNNVGVKADAITVTNVNAKDVIKVYTSAADVGKAKPVGTAKVKKDGTVTVKVRKGFKDNTEVYVTRTSVGFDESPFVTVKVGKDAVASTIDAANIVFTNNVDSADILTVKGLQPKQIIKVYKDNSTTAFKKATANKSGEAVIKFKAKEQFDVSDVLNITVSSKLEGESERMRVEIK